MSQYTRCISDNGQGGVDFRLRVPNMRVVPCHMDSMAVDSVGMTAVIPCRIPSYGYCSVDRALACISTCCAGSFVRSQESGQLYWSGMAYAATAEDSLGRSVGFVGILIRHCLKELQANRALLLKLAENPFEGSHVCIPLETRQ